MTDTPKASGGMVVIRLVFYAAMLAVFWWLIHHVRFQRTNDILSVGLAYFFVGVGLVYMLGGRLVPLGRSLAQSDVETPSKAILRPIWLTGITFFLGGVLIGAPPLLLPVIGEDDQAKTALFAGIVAVFALLTVFNIMTFRSIDEFYRRAVLESMALSFCVLQGALFLWAAAERFGLVPALNSWDAYTASMAGYLVLSIIIGRRAGIR
jgi:hypothetical protein